MGLIGVRELREKTSDIMRQVREKGAEYVVTYQGRPVAIILPLDTAQAEAGMVRAGREAIMDSWQRYQRLAEELRSAWPEDVSTQDLIDAIRR